MKQFTDRLKEAYDSIKATTSSSAEQRRIDRPLSEPLISSHANGQNEGVDEVADRQRRALRGRRAGPLRHEQERSAMEAYTDLEFMEQLKQEEEQVYREIEAKKVIEHEDRKLSLRLQSSYSTQDPGVSGETEGRNPLSLRITVPNGMKGGDMMRIDVPNLGRQLVQIPPSLESGDTFVLTSAYLSQFFPETVNQPGEVPSTMPSSGNNQRGGINAAVEGRRGNNVHLDISDAEVLASMTAEERDFYGSLPNEFKQDIMNEKRALIISSRLSTLGITSTTAPSQPSPGSPAPSSQEAKMLQVTIPEGLQTGDSFKILLPLRAGEAQRSLVVKVPVGLSAGEVIAIDNPDYQPEVEGQLLSAPAEQAHLPDESHPQPSISEEDLQKLAFLRELPIEVREEVFSEDRSMKELFVRHQDLVETPQTTPTDNPPQQDETLEEDPLISFGAEREKENAEQLVSKIREVEDASSDPIAMPVAAKDPFDLLSVDDSIVEHQPSPQASPVLESVRQNTEIASLLQDDLIASIEQSELMTIEEPAEPVISGTPTLVSTLSDAQQVDEEGGELLLEHSADEKEPAHPENPLEKLREAKHKLEQGVLTAEEFKLIQKQIVDNL